MPKFCKKQILLAGRVWAILATAGQKQATFWGWPNFNISPGTYFKRSTLQKKKKSFLLKISLENVSELVICWGLIIFT